MTHDMIVILLKCLEIFVQSFEMEDSPFDLLELVLGFLHFLHTISLLL